MSYKKSKFNFVPKELRFHPIYNKRNYVVFGVTLFVAFFGSINLDLYLKMNEKRESARSIASINSEFNDRIRSLTHSSADELNAKDATIRRALEDKIYWADAFKELSMIVPTDVWLTEFNTAMVDGKRVISISGQSGSSKKMTDFFASLERSYFFRDVQIKFSEKLSQFSPDLFRFKFECNVADPKAIEQKVAGAQ